MKMGQVALTSSRPNCPRKGIDSFATVGLSDRSIGMIMGGIPLGVEIVGACKQTFAKFPDILADCAMTVLNTQVKFHPGAVFKNSIMAHYRDLDMKHILFVPPYGWEQDFLTLDLPTKKVAWLMALPISDAELKFFNETESGELESLLKRKTSICMIWNANQFFDDSGREKFFRKLTITNGVGYFKRSCKWPLWKN